MIDITKTTATDEDMRLINAIAKAELNTEDVYTFRVVCCDNRIDRDQEQFSDTALEQMAKLYVGRTIIKDHYPSADNQFGRIYKTSVEQGENGLRQLVAWAYIPLTESAGDTIEKIETGVLKEVSVGCAVQKRICSICGTDIAACGHVKSRKYDGKECFVILDSVTDVYELSFVAVPAQKGAGVIKSFGLDVSRSGDSLAEKNAVLSRLADAGLLCAEIKLIKNREDNENETQ